MVTIIYIKWQGKYSQNSAESLSSEGHTDGRFLPPAPVKIIPLQSLLFPMTHLLCLSPSISLSQAISNNFITGLQEGKMY